MPSTTYVYIFFLLLRRPPSATLFPTRRSSDLQVVKNRNDRSDLTGRIEDFASRELHRQPAATVRIDQLDLSLPSRFCRRRQAGDKGGELHRVCPYRGCRCWPERRLLLEQRFRSSIEQDEVSERVCNHDRVAHVFNDQVKTIALATRIDLRLLQLHEVARQFFVSLTQIGNVAKDRHKAERLAACIRGRSGYYFKVDVGTFERIDKSDVALHDFGRRHRCARKTRREHTIVQS